MILYTIFSENIFFGVGGGGYALLYALPEV